MLTGLGLCALISVGLPYGEFVIKGTRLGLSSSTPAAFFLLFWLLALVQTAARAYAAALDVQPRRTAADHRDDDVGNGDPVAGLYWCLRFLPFPACSTTQPQKNNWAELLVSHIPHLAGRPRRGGDQAVLRGTPPRRIHSLWCLGRAAFLVVALYGRFLPRAHLRDGDYAAAVDGTTSGCSIRWSKCRWG